MTNIYIYIYYQKDIITSLFIKEVDRQQIYAFVIDNRLRQDEV